MQQLLETLRSHQLKAKLSKCFFGQNSVSYLGYIVDAQGIRVDPEKVQVIRDWPPPTNVTDLRSFLGSTNFYRKFVHRYSDIDVPLHALTKSKVPFHWGPYHMHAFNRLKDTLCTALVL